MIVLVVSAVLTEILIVILVGALSAVLTEVIVVRIFRLERHSAFGAQSLFGFVAHAVPSFLAYMTKHPLTVPPGQVTKMLFSVTLDQVASKVRKLNVRQCVGTTLRKRDYVINTLSHEIGSLERKINRRPTQTTSIVGFFPNLIECVMLMSITQDQGSTLGVVSLTTSLTIKLERIKNPTSVSHVKA